jgi:SOUL heme-binding protein
MGMVFGRITVEEPPHEILLKRAAVTSYELRRYSVRFAAEADYTKDGEDNAPFNLLARYIGVFGKPENEGSEAISMTAPVVIDSKGGTALKMTAPVVKTEGKKTMQFMLPKEYDELSKIPKPSNPAVHIKEIPAAVGAVHVFSGRYNDERTRKISESLAKQLRDDGLDRLSDETAIETYEFWGYNPPFTIPALRRNEVWIPLSEEEASRLVNEFNPSATN